MATMPQTMQEAVAIVVAWFNEPGAVGDTPVDSVAAALGSENYGEVDPYEVLEQAMEELGYEADVQQEVLAAAQASAAAEAHATATATAEGGYSLEQLAGIFAEGVNVTIDNSQEHIEIDNSIYSEGDGPIHQANYTELTDVDAAEGAIAAGGNIQGQQQTGDGTQIDDTYADDITTGDGNVSADRGGTIGDGNVDAGHISNSAFGQGVVDQSLTDNSTYTDNDDNSYTDNSTWTDNSDNSYTDNTTDSYDTENSYNPSNEVSDDDYVNVEVEVGTEGHDHYEPPVYEHGYEPVAEVYEDGPEYDDSYEVEDYD